MRLAVDRSTVIGITVACGGILLGLLLEGGKLAQILQPTAALIVFGGTLGAVLVQYPLPIVITATQRLKSVILQPELQPTQTISQLTALAFKARREGIIALDDELRNVPDDFTRKAVMLAVDGSEPSELRSIMQFDMQAREDHDEEIARVYESAGGFSPTLGIIGAVLGLIQVMQHLDNIDEVGRGIAVAFVATVYGVAAANLFFLPVAGKLRTRARSEQVMRELAVEGVVSILEGMNPRILETKLSGYMVNQTETSRSRVNA
ncbi:MAG TPA: flagellar motor protein [Terriglobales bacterium]